MTQITKPHTSFFDHPWAVHVLIAVLWVGAAVLVNPIGEFPLNDDWSYGRSVKEFLETGSFHIPRDWASMTLMLQLLWGALFCLPGGFSFTAVRLSTLVLGLTGVFASQAVIREIGVDRKSAWLLAATVLVNPVYFCLSNTFMTDVPFFALSAIAALYYIRFLKQERTADYVKAILWTLLCLEVRQLAVVLAGGFAIAYLYRRRFAFRSWVRAAAPAVLCMLTLSLHQAIGTPRFGFTNLDSDPLRRMVATLLLSPFDLTGWLLDDAAVVLIYLGLFLTPLLPHVFRALLADLRSSKLFLFAFLTITALLTGFVITTQAVMPLGRNYLRNVGLGPLTLSDTYALRLDRWPHAPGWFWAILTVLGIVIAALMCARWIVQLRNIFRKREQSTATIQPEITILFVVSALAYVFLTSAAVVYDRYLPFLQLTLGCGLLAALVPHQEASRRSGAGLTLLFCGLWLLFGIAGTHDYLAWNRVRWQTLNNLQIEQHISYERIDGGFEFNGFYGYVYPYQRIAGKSWWWIKDDEYRVTFGPLTGYETVQTRSFSRWLPPGTGTIYVLKRSNEHSGLNDGS